jgi:hypothetical protein
LVVRDGDLYLLGRDEVGPAAEDYVGAKGTCRAMVTFLERFCGVRWLAPTPIGTVVPPGPDLAVPGTLDETVVPAFGYGWGRAIYGVRNPASFANNWRSAVRIYTLGGHEWNVWVPVEKYYATHPEYFALINRVRSSSPSSYLCTSNPDVKRLIVAGIRAKFDAGYDWVELGQADSYQRCQCAICEALDNYRGGIGGILDNPTFWFETLRDNPCERILQLHRDVAAECLKSHPNKRVQILSYAPTLWPSKVFDHFPTNVVAELCTLDPRVVAAWRAQASWLTAYVYYWGSYHTAGLGPKFTAAQVAQSLRSLRDQGFQGVYFCGAGECWGLEGPAYYACGRLLANPDQDPQALVAEYCQGLYGPAATTMISFFQALDARVQLYSGIEARPGNTNHVEQVYCEMYPQATLDGLDSLLSTAESQATNGPAHDWVHLTRMSFDYVKLTAQAFSQYRAYKAQRNLANLTPLQQTVGAWLALRNQIINLSPTDINRWFPGQDSWVRFFNSSATVNCAPFTLNFAQLIAQFGGY